MTTPVTNTFAEKVSRWAMCDKVYPTNVVFPTESIETNFERLRTARVYSETPSSYRVTKRRLSVFKQEDDDKNGTYDVYGPNSFMRECNRDNKIAFKEASAALKRVLLIPEDDNNPELVFPICMVGEVGFGKTIVSSIRIPGDTQTILWPYQKERIGVEYGKRDKIEFSSKPDKSLKWRGVVRFFDDGMTKTVGGGDGLEKVSILGLNVKNGGGDGVNSIAGGGFFDPNFVVDHALAVARQNIFDAIGGGGDNTSDQHHLIVDIAIQGVILSLANMNCVASKDSIRIDKICQSDIFSWKFVLCLEDDVTPNLFPVAMASNSVPVCQFPFSSETLLHYGIKPWVHFVPIARDFSDLKDVAAKLSLPEMQPVLADIALEGKLHAIRMCDSHVTDELTGDMIKRWGRTSVTPQSS